MRWLLTLVATISAAAICAQTVPGPPDKAAIEESLARVREYHGGAGPWAVAGYRIGQRALKELKLPRYSFSLQVVHRCPAKVQFTCMADGLQAATGASLGKMNLRVEDAEIDGLMTVLQDRKTGKSLTFTLLPAFVRSIQDLPPDKLEEAGRRVAGLPDEEIFQSKEAWQPLLKKEIYQELAKREVNLIEALFKENAGKRALNRIKFGAVLTAALTMSAKDFSLAEDLGRRRETALTLATALSRKDDLLAARKMATQLIKGEAASKQMQGETKWALLMDAPTLMYFFLPKNEGGDGIHPDLQSNDQLKGRKNGILEKIRDLTSKELSAAAIAQEAKELELFGYRTAVIGSLVYHLVPAKMKANKTPQQWRDLAIEMRDHSISLAVAAKQADTAAVLKASTKLRSACSRCHNVF